ncbi:MAG: ABC transporter substrate-binding protein, partial [Actinomycetota bacterium]|nr:ABC transporter substrate-binding protein [Actinomycetota bacterium]
APGGTTPPGSTTPDTGGGGTTPAPAAVFEPQDNDAEGFTDDKIVIGIHAPVTGASPIPQESFDIGKDIYWEFLHDTAPDRLFGRQVEVVFRDDEFNPQHAVQVCREMVEEEGAFLLVGGGGADQITACAQYAAENGIPYLSAGVNEEGLGDLETYFATTMTYAEQAPLIIARLQEEGFTEAALVVADTPSFEDAFQAFKASAEEADFGIVYENRINKNASPTESATVAQELKGSGAEAVILLASPVVYVLGLASGAANQSYDPRWIGPGITSGLNAVTTFGCPAVGNGEFFSPVPALDIIDDLDPDFTKAYPKYAGGAKADDIGLQLWSLNKVIAQMLEATGEELGRAAFMNTLVGTAGFDNGIYPPVQFTADDHFGGTGAHLLEANCEEKVYVTAEAFVPGV